MPIFKAFSLPPMISLVIVPDDTWRISATSEIVRIGGYVVKNLYIVLPLT